MSDDEEPPPEVARKLMLALLAAHGAPIEPGSEAPSDALDARKDPRPLLGTDPKRADPPMPAVGRAPRKKT